jgi:hypothetical protein
MVLSTLEAVVTRENVTSMAQLPERPSLDVKLNPPVSVPLSDTMSSELLMSSVTVT